MTLKARLRVKGLKHRRKGKPRHCRGSHRLLPCVDARGKITRVCLSCGKAFPAAK